ncbi:hypothetical protein J28TS4_14850 [Paenibacillus lautus]|nr:hypothetical protein J28TS4_14850 [Paenibacillus lautus]
MTKEDTVMFAEERREKILALLNEEKRVMWRRSSRFQLIRSDVTSPLWKSKDCLRKLTVVQFRP